MQIFIKLLVKNWGLSIFTHFHLLLLFLKVNQFLFNISMEAFVDNLGIKMFQSPVWLLYFYDFTEISTLYFSKEISVA